ncbi:MAG TPA: hypothetical protein VKR58_02975 [Aquella sp.]|nr:hypothetical protein [Aquella sp.]
MIPIEWNKSNNVVYAENQPEYHPLPALRKANGRIMICWKLTWKERIKLLFTGKLYHQVLTFNYPLQPIILSTDYPEEFLN